MDGKPFVIIELDRPRKLRYTFNSLVLAEEVLGKPIAVGMLVAGMKELRILLWAGLKEEDSNLTLEQVGNLIDESPLGFEEITSKVVEALEISFVKKKIATPEKNSVIEN